MTKITACKGDQAVRLVADFRAWPQTTIKWYKENRELHNGSKYQMAYEDSVAELVIRNIFKNDHGTYTVVAANPFGEALLSAELVVEDAIDGHRNHGETHLLPSILVQPLSDQMIRVGKKARFTVAASYPPEPQVHWYKDKDKFEENDRFQISKQGGVCTLDITMVEPSDDGIWKCEVITSFGYAVSMARLRAVVPKGYRKPEFLEGLKALLTEQGTVSLECKVVGVPTPLLRWFKDGKEIKAGDMFNLQMQNNDESSLGTYTCVAINCMGKAVSSAQVTVMDKTEDKMQTKVKVEEPTPYFLESLEDRTIKVGENCRFTVRVRTPPVVQVTWYNKEEVIEMSEKYHLTQVDDGIFHLDVIPVEVFDEGEWRCVVVNPFGQSVSPCHLKLIVPKNYRSPEFVEDLQTIFTDDGLVSFECKVVGVPTPVLRWYKDGMELKPGDVHQLSGTNSLGSYSCVAKNCMGLATSSAELTLEDIYGAKERRKPPSRHPPRFTQHLKDEVVVIGDNFRFTVAVTCPPVPEVTWYKDNLRVEEAQRYHLRREKNGIYQLDLEVLELSDQGSWKCLAVNDYGHSLTQCCLRVIVPKHYKKPKFIENLRAVLSEEGTVSLECKVVGVPQPVLKWYKDGIELKAGDIYKIVSGEGGTSSLGTYTCEAKNCMGTASSTAALLAFDDKYLRDRLRRDTYQHDLSTIEERDEFSTYGTPSVTDNWDESKAEMEFSIYETPDITEDEARQIIEMFADEVSEYISLKEAPELPPLRFIKESAMVGNILMEAVIIDVPLECCSRAEDLSQRTPLENLATEADIADFSVMDPLVVDLPYDYSEAASLHELKVDFSSEGEVHIREASIKEPMAVDSHQPLTAQSPLPEEVSMARTSDAEGEDLQPLVPTVPEVAGVQPEDSIPQVVPHREPEVVNVNMVEGSSELYGAMDDTIDRRPTTDEQGEALSEDITQSEENLGTEADVESIASLEEIATDYVNGFADEPLEDEFYVPARTPVVEPGDRPDAEVGGRSTPTYESAMEYPPDPTAATPTPTPDVQHLLEAEGHFEEAGSPTKDPGLLAELASAVLQKAAEGIMTTAVLAESLVATAASLIIPAEERAGTSRDSLEEQAFALEEADAQQQLAEIEQTDFAVQEVAGPLAPDVAQVGTTAAETQGTGSELRDIERVALDERRTTEGAALPDAELAASTEIIATEGSLVPETSATDESKATEGTAVMLAEPAVVVESKATEGAAVLSGELTTLAEMKSAEGSTVSGPAVSAESKPTEGAVVQHGEPAVIVESKTTEGAAVRGADEGQTVGGTAVPDAEPAAMEENKTTEGVVVTQDGPAVNVESKTTEGATVVDGKPTALAEMKTTEGAAVEGSGLTASAESKSTEGAALPDGTTEGAAVPHGELTTSDEIKTTVGAAVPDSKPAASAEIKVIESSPAQDGDLTALVEFKSTEGAALPDGVIAEGSVLPKPAASSESKTLEAAAALHAVSAGIVESQTKEGAAVADGEPTASEESNILVDVAGSDGEPVAVAEIIKATEGSLVPEPAASAESKTTEGAAVPDSEPAAVAQIKTTEGSVVPEPVASAESKTTEGAAVPDSEPAAVAQIKTTEGSVVPEPVASAESKTTEGAAVPDAALEISQSPEALKFTKMEAVIHEEPSAVLEDQVGELGASPEFQTLSESAVSQQLPVEVEPIAVVQQMVLEDGITDENGNINLELALASVSLHSDQALQLDTVTVSEECPRMGDAEPRHVLQVDDNGPRNLAVVQTVDVWEHGAETGSAEFMESSLVPVDVPLEETRLGSLEVVAELGEMPCSEPAEGTVVQELHSATSGLVTVSQPLVLQAPSQELEVQDSKQEVIADSPVSASQTEEGSRTSETQQRQEVPVEDMVTRSEELSTLEPQDDQVQVASTDESGTVTGQKASAAERAGSLQELSITELENQAPGSTMPAEVPPEDSGTIPTLPESAGTVDTFQESCASSEILEGFATERSEAMEEGGKPATGVAQVGVTSEEHLLTAAVQCAPPDEHGLEELKVTSGDFAQATEEGAPGVAEKTEVRESKSIVNVPETLDSVIEAAGQEGEILEKDDLIVQVVVPESESLSHLAMADVSGQETTNAEVLSSQIQTSQSAEQVSPPETILKDERSSEVQPPSLESTLEDSAVVQDLTGTASEVMETEPDLCPATECSEMTAEGLFQCPVLQSLAEDIVEAAILEAMDEFLSAVGTSELKGNLSVQDGTLAEDDKTGDTQRYSLAAAEKTAEKLISSCFVEAIQEGLLELSRALLSSPCFSEETDEVPLESIPEVSSETTAQEVLTLAANKVADELVARCILDAFESLAEVIDLLNRELEDFPEEAATEDGIQDSKLIEVNVPQEQICPLETVEQNIEPEVSLAEVVDSASSMAVVEQISTLDNEMQSIKVASESAIPEAGETVAIIPEDGSAKSETAGQYLTEQVSSQEQISEMVPDVALQWSDLETPDVTVGSSEAVDTSFTAAVTETAVPEQQLESARLTSANEAQEPGTPEERLSEQIPVVEQLSPVSQEAVQQLSDLEKLAATAEVVDISCKAEVTEGASLVALPLDGSAKSETANKHLPKQVAAQEQIPPVALEVAEQLRDLEEPEAAAQSSEVVDTNSRAEVVVAAVQEQPSEAASLATVPQDGKVKSGSPDEHFSEPAAVLEQLSEVAQEATQQLSDLEKLEATVQSLEVLDTSCKAEVTEAPVQEQPVEASVPQDGTAERKASDRNLPEQVAVQKEISVDMEAANQMSDLDKPEVTAKSSEVADTSCKEEPLVLKEETCKTDEVVQEVPAQTPDKPEGKKVPKKKKKSTPAVDKDMIAAETPVQEQQVEASVPQDGTAELKASDQNLPEQVAVQKEISVNMEAAHQMSDFDKPEVTAKSSEVADTSCKAEPLVLKEETCKTDEVVQEVPAQTPDKPEGKKVPKKKKKRTPAVDKDVIAAEAPVQEQPVETPVPQDGTAELKASNQNLPEQVAVQKEISVDMEAAHQMSDFGKPEVTAKSSEVADTSCKAEPLVLKEETCKTDEVVQEVPAQTPYKPEGKKVPKKKKKSTPAVDKDVIAAEAPVQEQPVEASVPHDGTAELKASDQSLPEQVAVQKEILVDMEAAHQMSDFDKPEVTAKSSEVADTSCKAKPLVLKEETCKTDEVVQEVPAQTPDKPEGKKVPKKKKKSTPAVDKDLIAAEAPVQEQPVEASVPQDGTAELKAFDQNLPERVAVQKEISVDMEAAHQMSDFGKTEVTAKSSEVADTSCKADPLVIKVETCKTDEVAQEVPAQTPDKPEGKKVPKKKKKSTPAVDKDVIAAEAPAQGQPVEASVPQDGTAELKASDQNLSEQAPPNTAEPLQGTEKLVEFLEVPSQENQAQTKEPIPGPETAPEVPKTAEVPSEQPDKQDENLAKVIGAAVTDEASKTEKAAQEVPVQTADKKVPKKKKKSALKTTSEAEDQNVKTAEESTAAGQYAAGTAKPEEPVAKPKEPVAEHESSKSQESQEVVSSDVKLPLKGPIAKEAEVDKATDSDLSQEIPKSEGSKESRLKRRNSRKDKMRRSGDSVRGRTSRQDSRDSSTGEQTDEGEDFAAPSVEASSRTQKRVSRTTSGGDLARIHETEENAEKRRSSCPNVDPLPEIKELAESVAKTKDETVDRTVSQKPDTGAVASSEVPSDSTGSPGDHRKKVEDLGHDAAVSSEKCFEQVPKECPKGCSEGVPKEFPKEHPEVVEVTEIERKKTKTKKKSSKKSDKDKVQPPEMDGGAIQNGDMEVDHGTTTIKLPPENVPKEEKDAERDEGIEKETKEPEVDRGAAEELGKDTTDRDRSELTDLHKSEEKSSGYSTEDGKSGPEDDATKVQAEPEVQDCPGSSQRKGAITEQSGPEPCIDGPQLLNGHCEPTQDAVDGAADKKVKVKKTKKVKRTSKEEAVVPEVGLANGSISQEAVKLAEPVIQQAPRPEKVADVEENTVQLAQDPDEMAKMKEQLLAMGTCGANGHRLLIEELTSSFEDSSTGKTPTNVVVESFSDEGDDTLKFLDDDLTIREIDDSLMGVEEIPLDDLSLEDILENVRALRRLQTITEVDEITDEDDGQYVVVSALRPELEFEDATAPRRSHSLKLPEKSPVTRTFETIRRSSHGDRPSDVSARRTKDSPLFVTKLQDLTVPVGYRMRLTCCAIGTPEPKVQWLKNGSEITAEMGYRQINDFGICVLEIPRASPADSAEYTCIARNANGEDLTSARLIVRGKLKPDLVEPAFTRTILDMRGHCGDSITMDCAVIGWPTPNVVWLKDGHPLELDDRMTTTVTSGGTHRLVIQDALCSDSGVYKCFAQNSLGKDEITASVKIMDKTAYHTSRFGRGPLSRRNRPTGGPHHGEPPRFLSELEDRTAYLGSNVTFRCEVTGKPKPEITWLHNGHPLQPSSHVKFSQQDNSYTLTVLDSSYSDLGMYSCKATNQGGTAYTSGCLNFGLKDEEMEFGLAPVFITKPNSVSVERNEEIVLACKVEGKPRPKVTWLKGARDMSLSRRAYKDSKGDIHKLVIHRAMNVDDGEYIVEARNKLGKEVVRCSVNVQKAGSQSNGDEVWDYRTTTSALNELRGYRPYVQRKELPGPIGGEPKVTDTGRNWATLIWPRTVHDGGSSILAYRIEACELPGDAWEEIGLSPITICDLYNLKPESQYLFRVSARNMVGWGQPISMTNALVITRRPDLPHFTSIPPSCVQATVGSAITVECLVSGKPKPNISWYKDRERLCPLPSDRHQITIDGISTKLTIKDIQPEDEGCYMCEATNEGGRITTFTVVAVADETVPCPDFTSGSRPRTPRLDEASELPPVFSMRLRDRTVQVNGMVRLTCQIQGVPPPSVTWFKDGDEVRNSGHAQLIQEGNFYTLEIAKATEAHSGEYTIVANNNHGGVACKCRLIVDSDYNRLGQAPMFSKHLEDVSAMTPGHTATLHCKIVHPGGKTTWFHNGRKLAHSRKHRTKRLADGTCLLTILQVTESDAGTYTCVVSNESGRSSSTCTLKVAEEAYFDVKKSRLEQERARTEPHGVQVYSKAPIFLTKPRSTEVVEFDSVELVCEVVGDPKPEVLWLRDGLTFKYQKDPEHFIRVGDGPCYHLEIPSVTIDDTGTYAVVAHNCHGEAKAIISLQVFARGQGLEEGMSYKPQTKAGKVATRPEVVQILKDLQCADGDSATFECHIDAVPLPEVRWEKDGHVIRSGEDFQLFHEGQICRLRISEVFPEDEGEYVCIAYNDAGKVTTSAKLTVRCSDEKENDFADHHLDSVDVHQRPIRKRIVPESTSKPKKKMTGPKFITHPHNRVVDEGDTVKFTCSIAGHPEPLVQWDKLGRLLKTSGRLEVLEREDLHSLVIRDVVPADAGIYTVTASNTVGRVYATAKLDVVAKRKGKLAVPAPSPAPSILPPAPKTQSRVFTITAYDVGPPRILQPLTDFSTRSGEPLFMSCEIMSQPEARISWMLNEMVLKSSRTCRTRYNGRSATLHLDRLPNGFGAGEAVVSCTATNQHGTATTSAKLTITESQVHLKRPQNVIPETFVSKTAKWYPTAPDKLLPPKRWQKPTPPPAPQQQSPKCPPSPVRLSSTKVAQMDTVLKKQRGPSVIKLKSASPPVPPKPASRPLQSLNNVMNASAPVRQPHPVTSNRLPTPVSPKQPSEVDRMEGTNFRKGAPPVFLKELKDVVARDGQNVTLTVDVSGHPPFEIIWVHNDQEINNCDATRYVVHDDHRYSLVIGDIFPEDSGMYTCEAYNMFGDADISCRVHVTEPNCSSEPSTSRPRILTGLLEQTEAFDGDHLRLSVQISGKPAPVVEWLKDGQKLSAFIRIKTFCEGNRYICEFSRVRLRDSGIYSVMAANNLGRATASTALSVRARATPSRQLSTEIDDVLLTPCYNGNAGPLSTNGIDELHAEEKLSRGPESSYNPEANLGNLESDSSNELAKSFQMKWQSSSEVIASQHPQKSIREKQDEVEGGQIDMKLQVNANNNSSNGFAAPTIVVKESPPQIIRGPQNITILREQKACLKVHFIGKPQCSVKWIKGGRIVECNERIRMETCEEMSCLTLDNVHSDDSGKYIVVVENSHGADCHFASLAVEGPPDPPASKPVVSQVTTYSVTLCWYGSSYDGGSVITGYIVEMSQAEKNQWQVLTSNCHSTSYVATGLDSGTRYVFRILAQNVHGVSSPSKVSDSVLIKEESSDDDEVFSEITSRPLKKPPVAIEDGGYFGEMYDTKEELGKGRFGRVHRVFQKREQSDYAAKFIRCIKSKDKEAVKEEIAIMNCLHHPKLLQLIAAFEKPREIIIILEYISGGELFERVVDEDFDLTEKDCILFTRQICEGVRYMHEQSVMHLDLKPENILCLHRENHQIKLIDFGLARKYDPDCPIRVMFGTPEFVAPEIINYETISPASDMWSIGVICYVLLSGLSPFMGDNDAETFSNITRSVFDFEDESFDAISQDAKDFISALLVKKKEKRMSAQECIKHHWLAQHERTMSSVKLCKDKLKKFIVRRKWQKTGNAIRALGRMVSLSGLNTLRSPFKSSSVSNYGGSSFSDYGSGGSDDCDTLSNLSCNAPVRSIPETDEDSLLADSSSESYVSERKDSDTISGNGEKLLDTSGCWSHRSIVVTAKEDIG